MTLRVATGLERIALGEDAVLSRLRGRRLGLCAHPASVDSRLRHARFVLQGQGLDVRVLRLPFVYGDGDPHTVHTTELVPRTEAVLPELEDLVRAMQHCTGAICVSDEHEFRFVWTRGELSRIELADRPPCTPTAPGAPRS